MSGADRVDRRHTHGTPHRHAAASSGSTNPRAARVGMPGERRDYFRIRPCSWERLVVSRLRGYEDMHLLAERGLRLPVAKDDDVRDRLDGMHLVYEVLAEHVPAMLEELSRRLAR